MRAKRKVAVKAETFRGYAVVRPDGAIVRGHECRPLVALGSKALLCFWTSEYRTTVEPVEIVVRPRRKAGKAK